MRPPRKPPDFLFFLVFLIVPVLAIIQGVYVLSHWSTPPKPLTLQQQIDALTQRVDALQVRIDAIDRRLSREAIYLYIRRINPQLVNRIAWRESGAIEGCSRVHHLDARLLTAVLQTESSFEPHAVGADRERGLGQITHVMAHQVGLPWDRAFNIHQNVCTAALLLKRFELRYGSARAALRRYNGGNAYASVVLARTT